MSASFQPIWVTELELEGAPVELVAPARSGRPYGRVRCLLHRRGEPLGCVELALREGRARADALVAELAAGAEWPWDCAVTPGAGGSRPISVVVCTRERPRELRVALASVLRCDPGPLEVLVVDSAPRTGATARVVAELADARLRLVREPRGGLSRARNLGLELARGEVLAFTDDDVRVHRSWLRGLLRGVERRPEVGCVTGPVLAAELETPAQLYFERRAGWSGPGRARLYDLREHTVDSPLYPYLPGTFGAGANFALTRSAVAAVGDFDQALGAGSRAAGGEDLDLFLRVLQAGMAIAHEPTAVVWHYHRREAQALGRQLVGYGSGLTALATKLVTSPETAADARRRIKPAAARVLSVSGRERTAIGWPRMQAAEMWGLLVGPSRYLRGQMGGTQ